MKKALVERSIVVVLFVLVLVVFTFAQRDTQRMFDQYNQAQSAKAKAKAARTSVALVQPAASSAGN